MTPAARTETSGRRHALATVFAVTSHGVLLFGLSKWRPPPLPFDPGLVIDFETLEKAPSPPPKRRLAAQPEGRGATPRAKAFPTAKIRSQEPPSPAAGASDVPLDLTGDTLMIASTGSGAGTAGAGGAGPGTVRGPGGPSGTGAGRNDGDVNRATAVALPEQRWSCPWPAEADADAERIDEQTVVIRVVVNAEGVAETAEIIAEPGHGFGKAAVVCALETRFMPAHDREGHAMRASSPPIRVRFTR